MASVPFTVGTLPTGVYLFSILDTDFPDEVYMLGPGVDTISLFNGVSTAPIIGHFVISGLVSGLSGISSSSSFSATNGTITTVGSGISTPTGQWDITALPFTDSSGNTIYSFPDTDITLTTTAGGNTYTTTLKVVFIVIK